VLEDGEDDPRSKMSARGEDRGELDAVDAALKLFLGMNAS